MKPRATCISDKWYACTAHIPHAKWKVHLTRWQVRLDMAKRALDLSNKLACAIRDDEAAMTPPPSLVKMVYYGPQYNGFLRREGGREGGRDNYVQ